MSWALNSLSASYCSLGYPHCRVSHRVSRWESLDCMLVFISLSGAFQRAESVVTRLRRFIHVILMVVNELNKQHGDPVISRRTTPQCFSFLMSLCQSVCQYLSACMHNACMHPCTLKMCRINHWYTGIQTWMHTQLYTHTHTHTHARARTRGVLVLGISKYLRYSHT